MGTSREDVVAVYATCSKRRLLPGLRRLEAAGFTGVLLAPASQWKPLLREVRSGLDTMRVELETKNVNYEDGHLVSFAGLLWRAGYAIVLNDGTKASKAIEEMARRMSGQCKIKIINPTKG